MAAILEQISRSADAPVWGFFNPVNATEVANAVTRISAGAGSTLDVLHILSGTRGACSGAIGAVTPGSQERMFYREDLLLEANTYGRTSVKVHEFNTSGLASLPQNDAIMDSMSRLNAKMREVIGSNPGSRNGFLLAYCCSAGKP